MCGENGKGRKVERERVSCQKRWHMKCLLHLAKSFCRLIEVPAGRRHSHRWRHSSHCTSCCWHDHSWYSPHSWHGSSTHRHHASKRRHLSHHAHGCIWRYKALGWHRAKIRGLLSSRAFRRYRGRASRAVPAPRAPVAVTIAISVTVTRTAAAITYLKTSGGP